MSQGNRCKPRAEGQVLRESHSQWKVWLLLLLVKAFAAAKMFQSHGNWGCQASLKFQSSKISLSSLQRLIKNKKKSVFPTINPFGQKY